MKFLVLCDICECGSVEPHYDNVINVCNDCKDTELADKLFGEYIDAMESAYQE